MLKDYGLPHSMEQCAHLVLTDQDPLTYEVTNGGEKGKKIYVGRICHRNMKKFFAFFCETGKVVHRRDVKQANKVILPNSTCLAQISNILFVVT